MLRPTWGHVCPKADLGVKNLKWHVEESPKPVTVLMTSDGDQIPGFIEGGRGACLCG